MLHGNFYNTRDEALQTDVFCCCFFFNLAFVYQQSTFMLDTVRRTFTTAYNEHDLNIYTELWKCDQLEDKTVNAQYKDRTRPDMLPDMPV